MAKLLFQKKFILHPQFLKRIEDIRQFVRLPKDPVQIHPLSDYPSISSGKLTLIEDYGVNESIKLNPNDGILLQSKYPILAYDESIEKYPALEGDGYLTSHSLILVTDTDYVSSNYLTFAFYTRSQRILKNVPSAQKVGETTKSPSPNENPSEIAYKTDYANDRSKFILESCLDNAILFIDGALIGGQINAITVKLNETLLSEKRTFPVFIVKNSSSNLVTDNTPELKGEYNSDLHWAYEHLDEGERTPLFLYQDPLNPNFSKVFCYIKPFKNASTQRVEIHPSTYQSNETLFRSILDLIYYYYLDQGPVKNIQIRPIAIAEMYAQETKKLYNMRRIMQSSQIQPTMNNQRGMI